MSRIRRRRLLGALQTVLVLSVFSAGAFGIAMLVAIEHTAEPEFCLSCHNMKPYYDSWKNSKHNIVPCIECHYEPGSVETLEGKFKALSQIAKYVTRTQGTKPWAEISDQSCMRSGCHYTRLLEGPIQYGRVKFNHRAHLLESRRGRRLRCTSCHSQIVQGTHMAVTPTVCFICHFKPDADGKRSATSNCNLCHGAPTKPVDAAGRPFEHTPYVQRGVDCQECHRDVVRGEGLVRKERCRQCHGEVGHIQRFKETEFIHEMHVTTHKVECFECHEEIEHGLMPLAPPSAGKDSCNNCHVSPHDANRFLYAGTGALGVEPKPSRMYQTRIACEACHTGRSGYKPLGTVAADGAAAAAGSPAADHALPAGLGEPPVAAVARAAEVDCLHCHGTRFEGMLTRWQDSVTQQLERQRPLLEGLRERIGQDATHPAWQLYAEARRNIELVERDGSKGVHNIGYALDALHASAERLENAWAILDPNSPRQVSDGFPLRTASRCSDACHLGIEQTETMRMASGKDFLHRRHLLQAKLDCATCHSTEKHGQPAFPRSECGSCHHQVPKTGGELDCASCHSLQKGTIAGQLEGFKGDPSPMADSVTCDGCHGQAPDIARPKPETCVNCHDAAYGDMLTEWHKTADELRAKVEQGLATAASRGIDAAAIESARKALDAVVRDGSRGGHNSALTESMLTDAARKLGMQ